MVSDWIETELQTLDLGDPRRERRLAEVLSSMAGSPSKSIPSAVLGGHNETTAAYRLFDNTNLDFENLLTPHIDSSYLRVAEQKQVVLVQDTTELDLTRPNSEVEGAGPLDGSSRRGEFLHPLFALTESGTPLGTLYAQLWTRDFLPSNHDERKRIPIEQKESSRWLETHRHAQQIAQDHPETEFICVADSEADIFEVIQCDLKSPENFGWVIRSCYDRRLEQEDSELSQSLSKKLNQSEIRYYGALSVRGRKPKVSCTKKARKQPRESRGCRVEVRATEVTLRPPSRPDRRLKAVSLHAVLVKEIDPPEGLVPVSWTLLTNLPIENESEIRRVISSYCHRWSIEIFFRTLKSGTRIEAKRFEKLERFERCLAVALIIAWRTYYVARLSRENPEVSCEVVFTKDEWKPVYQLVMEEAAPSEPPNLRMMVRLIARLGGYIERPKAEEPGNDTVMRGMERLHDISLCWRAFGPKDD